MCFLHTLSQQSAAKPLFALTLPNNYWDFGPAHFWCLKFKIFLTISGKRDFVLYCFLLFSPCLSLVLRGVAVTPSLTHLWLIILLTAYMLSSGLHLVSSLSQVHSVCDSDPFIESWSNPVLCLFTIVSVCLKQHQYLLAPAPKPPWKFKTCLLTTATCNTVSGLTVPQLFSVQRFLSTFASL